MVAILAPQSSSSKFIVVLSLIFLSHALASASYIAWLSWTSDLVPDERLGRFFGTRNMLNGAAGMVAMVVFGYLLDYYKKQPGEAISLGFAFIFVSAVSFGLLSVRFLCKISEPPMSKSPDKHSCRDLFCVPFKDSNFRRFLFFSLFWSFAVNFASPFFTLYFLRDLQFSYGFVAMLGMVSTLSDLTAMQMWGRISDKVKNKAVIQFAGWVAIFLPLAWVMIKPGAIVLPIILHVLSGSFWAGINLCKSNLLLRIAPRENRASFLGAYNVIVGVSAATGPILAGTLLTFMSSPSLRFYSWPFVPLHLIFMISSLLRLLSLQLLKHLREQEAADIGELIRVLRSVRGLDIASGFNAILHPFIEGSQKDSLDGARSSGKRQLAM